MRFHFTAQFKISMIIGHFEEHPRLHPNKIGVKIALTWTESWGSAGIGRQA